MLEAKPLLRQNKWGHSRERERKRERERGRERERERSKLGHIKTACHHPQTRQVFKPNIKPYVSKELLHKIYSNLRIFANIFLKADPKKLFLLNNFFPNQIDKNVSFTYINIANWPKIFIWWGNNSQKWWWLSCKYFSI